MGEEEEEQRAELCGRAGGGRGRRRLGKEGKELEARFVYGGSMGGQVGPRWRAAGFGLQAAAVPVVIGVNRREWDAGGCQQWRGVVTPDSAVRLVGR